MSHHGKHDQITDNGYKQRCYCEKCKAKYDEWCKRQADKGQKICKRRCYTICEVVCKQPKLVVDRWGYKKHYEGKWENYNDFDIKPKHCKRCQKDRKHCTCNH